MIRKPSDYHRIHIDVGANEGHAVLHYARYEPDSLIIAFEPVPSLAAMIVHNSRHLTNLMVVQKAVSDYNGSDTLKISPFSEYGNHSCSSLSNFSEKSETEWPGRDDMRFVGSVPINVITLKNFIIQNEIPKIDYLKIDAQGHDLRVLKGLGELIGIVASGEMEAGVSTDILYEGQNTKEESIKFLEENGFEITDVTTNDDFSNEVNIYFKNKTPKTLSTGKVFYLG